MTEKQLTLACADLFDRTSPLIAGEVDARGLDLRVTALRPIELMARYGDFDVCEVPLAAAMGLRGMQGWDYVCIPILPHRAFQHRNVLVHTDSGIESPQDLTGKTIATTGLFYSGTVWMRGILQEHYGVHSADVRWVTNNTPDGAVRQTLGDKTAATMSNLERVDDDLSELLSRGEVDAWLGPTLPACFLSGAPRVVRLFKDYRSVEQHYADEVGYIPVLHAIAVRREILDDDPTLAGTLVNVFEESRQVGHRRLVGHGVPAVTLPWLAHDLETLPRLFDGDWFPAGLDRNRVALDKMCSYAQEQGLLPRGVGVSDLFAPVP